MTTPLRPLLTLLALLMLCPSVATANGSGRLGTTFDASLPGGIAIAVAGTAGRVDDTPRTEAELTVTLPNGVAVERAFLYVHTHGILAPFTLDVTLDGRTITTDKIGEGGSTC